MSLALNPLLFASMYKYGFSKLAPKLVTRVVFLKKRKETKADADKRAIKTIVYCVYRREVAQASKFCRLFHDDDVFVCLPV